MSRILSGRAVKKSAWSFDTVQCTIDAPFAASSAVPLLMTTNGGSVRIWTLRSPFFSSFFFTRAPCSTYGSGADSAAVAQLTQIKASATDLMSWKTHAARAGCTSDGGASDDVAPSVDAPPMAEAPPGARPV